MNAAITFDGDNAAYLSRLRIDVTAGGTCDWKWTFDAWGRCVDVSGTTGRVPHGDFVHRPAQRNWIDEARKTATGELARRYVLERARNEVRVSDERCNDY